jgi:hypothetical protein
VDQFLAMIDRPTCKRSLAWVGGFAQVTFAIAWLASTQDALGDMISSGVGKPELVLIAIGANDLWSKP